MRSTPDSKLRSAAWFDNPANIDMTALYLERYLNFGISLEELRSGRPVIGIAQTGSDLSPCNRHHLVLAERVREGIREAGGFPYPASQTPWQEMQRGVISQQDDGAVLTPAVKYQRIAARGVPRHNH